MPEMTVLPSQSEPVCAVEDLRKTYGAVRALRGVSLEFAPGEVHAILGENGAGKSTLMRILAGAESPDEGLLKVRGQAERFSSVLQANRKGIAIVFQELSLFPDLDVLSNLFVLKEPTRFGMVQRGRMRRTAMPILSSIGLDVGLNELVEHLGLHDQQLLEIAKALVSDSRLLILDEPTSALNAEATERLFTIVRQLRESGVSVLFISHRLEEVFAIADRITVMRDGSVVSTRCREDTDMRRVVREMIGRSPSELRPRSKGALPEDGELRISALCIGDHVRHVNLLARSGEVIGLAGLDGAGQTAVMEAIFGMHKPSTGSITLPSGKQAPRSISKAVSAGVAMVPADRRTEGLMLDQDIETNISHVVAGVQGKEGMWLRRRQLRQRAQRQIGDMGIVADSIHARTGSLSGGNQQKVLIGRWLEASPDVLLLNDPTRGVDVGAKAEIYGLIRRLAGSGKIVIVISTEQIEYEYLCDRVLIFYRGTVAGELQGADITEHAVLSAINTGMTHPLSQGARLLLEGFVDEVGKTAALVELRERDTAVLDAVVADGQPSVIDEAGMIHRARDSAGGLAMLAQLSPTELEELYPTDGAEPARPPVDAELGPVRSAGYAIRRSDIAVVMAAPVTAGRGSVRAALVVSVPVERWDEAAVPALSAQLITAAERIAQSVDAEGAQLGSGSAAVP